MVTAKLCEGIERLRPRGTRAPDAVSKHRFVVLSQTRRRGARAPASRRTLFGPSLALWVPFAAM